MAKLYESPCGDLVITRYRGGITADHVLRPSVHLNAACIQIAFDLVPIGRFAQVGQQMAQPVIAKIQWLDDLGGQLAQRVVHALEIGFHRHFPVVAFREDIGQPNDRRPPPADPPLCPMARDMPVQDLREAHRDHLPNMERHIVDPLSDDDQLTFPKDLRGLLTQMYSHGVLSSLLEMSPIRLEDNNWASLAKIPFHTASENLPKIQFGEFVYSEWRDLCIRISGFVENCVRIIFSEYSVTRAQDQVKVFVSSK